MRSALLAASLLLLAIPSALGGITVPTVLQDGGFENGLASWRCHPHSWDDPQVVAPGADGTGQALRVANTFEGSYGCQHFPARGGPDAIYLWDFAARIPEGRANPGLNVIELLSGWPSGPVVRLVTAVAFRNGGMGFSAWGSPEAALPMPAGDGWHRFEVVLDATAGRSKLAVDGAVLATVDRAYNADPDVIIAGDVACCDRGGAAPTVDYDDVTFCADRKAPAVEIQRPVRGAVYALDNEVRHGRSELPIVAAGPLTARAAISDECGLVAVTFTLPGGGQRSFAGPPYELVLDPPPEGSGQVTLGVRAVDRTGRTTVASVQFVHVGTSLEGVLP